MYNAADRGSDPSRRGAIPGYAGERLTGYLKW
jgi:hypothetical protein